MVEGISELSEGVLLGERYQLVRRLDLFSAGAERVAGVEYEYWVAVDVASEAEVWIQFAATDGLYAEGSALAGAVAALRRINHPAVPAVHAFGEYEFAREGEVASVGYCAIPASAGETLAAALLRGELDQAEILVALGQVAEVLELLAEFELVHGHLSAHSVLLHATEGAGYEVVVADLPASLALETTLESDLTGAADVYALAWLIVLALVGPAVLEAEFGAGFAVTTELELELQAEEVVGRRLAWAAEYLVVLGVSTELAEVLLLALGEAVSRPRPAVLTAALRAEWMLFAEGAVEDVVEAEAAAAVGAEAVTEAAVVAEMVAAAEAAQSAESAESVETVEVVETAEVVGAAGTAGAAKKAKPRKKAKTAAEVAGVAVVVGVAEILAAESAAAAVGAGNTAGAPAANAGAGAAASTKVAAGATTASGAAGGTAAAGASIAGAAEVTAIIPKIRQGARPAPVRAATPSVGVSAGSGGSRGPSGGGPSPQHGRPRRPHPGVLVGGGVGLVIVIVLIIVFATGPSKGGNTASGSVATTAAAATSASPSTGASASGAASASTGSSAGSATSTASATGPIGAGFSFPATLETVPATAGQAVQEIQTAATQAKGELSGSAQSQLTQAVGTLNQEIGSGQSISTGLTQLWTLLHSGELPSSLNTYLIQLATYLSASQGS